MANVSGLCGMKNAVFPKTINMKSVGIVLLVIGIGMILVKGFSVTTEKKIIDAGPIQVNKKENHWVGWPTYLGAVIAVAGVILVVGGRRKSTL
jgi:hypothetical protein